MEKLFNYIKDPVRKIRDGLFLAPSRSYGEQYVEPFIRAKYNFDKPKNDSYDASDKNGKKYEIKSCKVLLSIDKKDNLVDRIVFENDNIETNRLIPFKDAETAKYLANVQNVKRDHFDYLIYVLLFADCVKIFQVEKDKVNAKTIPNWSDKHGRYDELGKSGQFGITKVNIKYHIDNYLKDTITYDEMTEIYKDLSK